MGYAPKMAKTCCHCNAFTLNKEKTDKHFKEWSKKTLTANGKGYLCNWLVKVFHHIKNTITPSPHCKGNIIYNLPFTIQCKDALLVNIPGHCILHADKHQWIVVTSPTCASDHSFQTNEQPKSTDAYSCWGVCNYCWPIVMVKDVLR